MTKGNTLKTSLFASIHISVLGRVEELHAVHNRLSWKAPEQTICPIDGYSVTVKDLRSGKEIMVSDTSDTSFVFGDSSDDQGWGWFSLLGYNNQSTLQVLVYPYRFITCECTHPSLVLYWSYVYLVAAFTLVGPEDNSTKTFGIRSLISACSGLSFRRSTSGSELSQE